MSPVLIVLRIAIIIFAVEGVTGLAVPALLPTIHAMAVRSEWILAAVDSIALVLISCPLIFFWVIRPYILARAHAESVLRESEARYQELFDDSPAAIWVDDWSAIKEKLDALAAEGVSDWHSFFSRNPEELKRI